MTAHRAHGSGIKVVGPKEGLPHGRFGRVCGRSVVDLVASELKISPTDTDRYSAANRPIITPIPLGVLAAGE